MSDKSFVEAIGELDTPREEAVMIDTPMDGIELPEWLAQIPAWPSEKLVDWMLEAHWQMKRDRSLSGLEWHVYQALRGELLERLGSRHP
jgi:hypothetical protein